MSKISGLEKNALKREIKKTLGLKSSYKKPIGYICGTVEIHPEVLSGLGQLEADFVVFSEDTGLKKASNIVFTPYENVAESVSGFDFFVCSDSSQKTEYFIRNKIVPIVQNKHYLRSILKEFNPLEAKGNCFLYEKGCDFSMLGSVMKYLLNYNFEQDKNSLIKNLSHI